MLSPRVRWTAQVVALVFLLTYLIWFPQTYNIVGESMEPNLHNGGRAMVIHQNYTINRFDIIVIDNSNKLIIKRVAGLPGEDVIFLNGHLFINNNEIEQPFLSETRLVRIEAYRFRLAANEYFVLGDNRPVSMDSRAIGPVKRNDIKGKMIFRIW